MNSLAEPAVPHRLLSRWFALALCLAVAILSSYQTYAFRPAPTEQEIARAEDAVYEAVVRNMLPHFDQDHKTLLVFDDRLVADSFPPGDFTACREASDLPLKVSDEPVTADNISDKSNGPVVTPGSDVVQDYVAKRCIRGQLSRTFHTNVPRNFLGDHVGTNERILPSPDHPKFAELFPVAPGLIGFSRVGLSKQMDEAIVYSSFYCGGLCASGTRYYLKKVGTEWKVLSSRILWVS